MSTSGCSTCREVVTCPAPLLTIVFPNRCTSDQCVQLANGAIVDLVVLGQIISKFCPDLFDL